MIKAFIIIRLKQIYRILIEIGLIRIIFLMGLIGFSGIILFMYTSKFPNALKVSIGFLLLLGLLQVKRKDKLFLKSQSLKYKLIFLVEYSILSIPILAILLYHSQWISTTVLILGILLSINIDFPSKNRTLNTKLQRLIPYDCFEWKAGVRKGIFLLIPFWLIGLLTSFYIGSVPITIFIIGILIISFNEKCEPYQMILAYEKSAEIFLLHKIKKQIVLFSLLMLPLIISFLIFHSEFWYIVVAEYLIFIFLHIYFLLTKYAFYESNEKPPGTQLYATIGTLGLLIPLFIPVLLLLSIRFYYKSIHNLNYYLNDYN